MPRGYYACALRLCAFRRPRRTVESRGLLSRNGWKTGGPAELADGVKNRDHPFRYRMSVISIVRIPEATRTDYSCAGPASARRIRLRAAASVNGSRGFA